MNRSIPLLFVLAIMMSGWAFSHAKLASTVPADGDFVGSLSKITLEFAAEVELTGAELKSGSFDLIMYLTAVRGRNSRLVGRYNQGTT